MISYGGEGKETTDGVNESCYAAGRSCELGFEDEDECEDEDGSRRDGVMRNFLLPPAFGMMVATP
jgi:hypothetical protein